MVLLSHLQKQEAQQFRKIKHSGKIFVKTSFRERLRAWFVKMNSRPEGSQRKITEEDLRRMEYQVQHARHFGLR